MSLAHYCLLLAIVTLLGLANVVSATTAACLPANSRKNGMNVNFYQYSLMDSSTYSNAAYMAYQYADKVKLGSVSGQTDISINYNLPCVTTSGTYQCPQEDAYGNWGCRGKGRCSNSQAVSYWSTDLFGFYTTPTNITLEMTGYFLPPQTGSYTFSFATVDDSAILSVGGSIAFECCAQEQPPITSTNFTINGIKPWHGSLPDNIAGTVYMYAGFYYPMKIVYSNAVSWGTLPISVTLPDGTTVSDDFEGYVYTFDNNLSQPNCTIPDPSNYTVSTTITTTEPWTGTFTSTSTEMTTITGTNGVPTDETIIVVKTPTTASTIITTTEPWTGTFTSTSTEMTTVTGTNGLPTDETVIVVKTPTTAISSSLSSSSGQITSSITSSRPIITPFYPSNGTSVISSSVISSSVTSSLFTSSPVISSSVISSSTTTSTSIFSESSKSSVIPTSSSTSGSSESKTSSASSSSSSSSISSESPKSTYSSSSLPPVTSAATSQETASSLPPVTSVTTSQEITSSLPPVISTTTSQETASSLPPVTSATTSQETASSLPPATTTKTSEQTTLVTVTSCESHVCTESISSAIVSTATVIVSGVTTEYTTWCPISTTEITKQTTETTKQTKGTTEQTTETTKQTTVVTISSCESDICSKTASPAIVSTSTATINGVTTEYTTWCPISTTESKQQTTLVTVTSCESGVCSETTSPAIVSTATATVNDVVTVYPTWRPQTTNEQSVSSKMNSATSETTTNTGAAETKTAVTSSLSRFNHAETQTASATDVIGHSSSVVSVSETGNTKGLITSELSTMSQQPRSTPASSMVGSSTASLEISTYVGIANGLLTNNGISVFISTVLLAIVW
ncbi:ADM_collapsed_G0000030.mRNA.1.CDS.1 [Saccharomyces cerevisiae]|nr:BBT_HP_G0052280.mRNA.1.CDS.1 [Saccharomyces cerevisiae]CAI5001056.1 BBT_HP_G0080990.mRNA.1.CDS.1 [Saccharomyces cerevisiae]CAI5006723.1 BBT_HP_G0086200.mRNA.1.CDS.1 [Saccharomyces cerevisiae]CAI6380324.1 BBF_HP1_G0000060.mRNA.1.CDS.1 [Saccharomyces cerevisiae]CAI6465657.1 ADM_collapsed_G0000030.mRNA.1.CDS.1 [Saccharomyces cerevisiae]